MQSLKKIDYLRNNIIMVKDKLLCPICNSDVNIINNSIKCNNKHTFDISNKGYFVFYKTSKIKSSRIYDSELFASRREFINYGFYAELHNIISNIINTRGDSKLILDLGCGEATHDKFIIDNTNNNTIIGVDISKEGIKMASDYVANNIIPIILDLNNLPFKQDTFDIIIDILSPSNEKEIRKVLKKDGIIIKVTPQKKYLYELREIFNIDDYKNEKEIDRNIKNNYNVIEKFEIEKTYNLNKKQLYSLINMTPLLKNKFKSEEVNLNNITIALNVYILGISEANNE